MDIKRSWNIADLQTVSKKTTKPDVSFHRGRGWWWIKPSPEHERFWWLFPNSNMPHWHLKSQHENHRFRPCDVNAFVFKPNRYIAFIPSRKGNRRRQSRSKVWCSLYAFSHDDKKHQRNFWAFWRSNFFKYKSCVTGFWLPILLNAVKLLVINRCA